MGEKLVANQSTCYPCPTPILSLKIKLMWLGEKHERRSCPFHHGWKVIEKFILSFIPTSCQAWNKVLLKEEEQNTDWNCNQNRTCRKEGNLLIFLVADKGLKTNSYRVIDFIAKQEFRQDVVSKRSHEGPKSLYRNHWANQWKDDLPEATEVSSTIQFCRFIKWNWDCIEVTLHQPSVHWRCV